MGDEETELELKQRFKTFRTLYEMLHDRGYDNEDVTFEQFTYIEDVEEFAENFRDPNKELVFQNANTRDVIVVTYTTVDRYKKEELTSAIRVLQNHSANHLIIILRSGSLQTAIKKGIPKIEQQKSLKIEIFTIEELQYNVTHHMYVPKHKPLSNAEKDDLFRRYKISSSQLPLIKKEDPVARYYGAEPGTVIEITRRSETCGRYITYRIVV